MEIEPQDAPEVLETPEVQPDEQLTPDEIAELKEKAAKADDLEAKNKQLFERAKKAEETKKEPSDLSARDLLALSKADLHPDDLEELQEFASYKKLSLADALNQPMMKALLADKAAERKTADATQTKGARGAQKPQGEELLKRAETTGEVPETADGLQELWRARMARKKS